MGGIILTEEKILQSVEGVECQGEMALPREINEYCCTCTDSSHDGER